MKDGQLAAGIAARLTGAAVLALVLAACGGCGKSRPGSIAYGLQKYACLAVAEINFHQSPCISPDQIQQAGIMLQCGDIILRHRYGNLTNSFIPGFWTHAAIYLGTPQDLTRLGLDRKPEIAPALRRYADTPQDGRPLRAIHATVDGVQFSPLEDIFEADAILVLRPRCSEATLAAALAAALACLDWPYNFDFEPDTPDQVTCTDLVWRTYGSLLEMRPQTVLGKTAFVADDIAAGYSAAKKKGVPPKLEFVLLLMGDSPDQTATFRTEDQLPQE